MMKHGRRRVLPLIVLLAGLVLMLSACPAPLPLNAPAQMINDYNQLVFAMYAGICATIVGGVVQILVAIFNSRKIDRNILRQNLTIEKSEEAIKAGNGHAEKFVKVTEQIAKQEEKLEKVVEKAVAPAPIINLVVPPVGAPTPQPGDRRSPVTVSTSKPKNETSE